jgi:hypothetical protein
MLEWECSDWSFEFRTPKNFKLETAKWQELQCESHMAITNWSMSYVTTSLLLCEFCAAELMVYLPVVYIIYYLKLSWLQDSLKSSLAISHVRCLKETDISMTISVLIIRDVTRLVYVMFHYITCIRWKGLCVCRFTSGKEIKMCLSESVLNCC